MPALPKNLQNFQGRSRNQVFGRLLSLWVGLGQGFGVAENHVQEVVEASFSVVYGLQKGV